MACARSFRQVCDKPCSSRILSTCWSPAHDLIAVIATNGDARLHRMCWQKVWVVPAKESHASVLAWRPDGKVLAVGYRDGCVKLLEVEKSTVIHAFFVGCAVTSLAWNHSENKSSSSIYKDQHTMFVPVAEGSEGNKQDGQVQQAQNPEKQALSCLAIGTANGRVSLFVDGIFHAAQLARPSVETEQASGISVVDLQLSVDNSQVTVVYSHSPDEENPKIQRIFLRRFQLPHIAPRSTELAYIAKKYEYTCQLMKTCEAVLKQLSDASEDICSKISSKLQRFEEMLPSDTSVSAEFTTAFAFGIASAELQAFLTQDLTVKGLKQVGQSVRSSYSNLQNNIKDNLDSFTQALLFHFTELRGLSKWYEKFGIVGLSQSNIDGYLACLNQFILKVLELLKVISSDMLNLRVFFTWLAHLVVQFSGESNSTPFKQFTSESYDVMLNFLEYRLTKIPNKKMYDLERVTQFFKEGTMERNEDVGGKSWYDFLCENELLQKSPFIIQPNDSLTLQELFKQLREKFISVFRSVEEVLSDAVAVTLDCMLFSRGDDHQDHCQVKIAQRSLDDGSVVIIVLPCTCDCDKMFILKLDERCDDVKVYGLSAEVPAMNDSGASDYRYTIRDVVFYSSEIISVLVEEEYVPSESVATILGQLPMTVLNNDRSITVHANKDSGILDQDLNFEWIPVFSSLSRDRKMDSFRGSSLSVSGVARQTACVVASSGRRVRVFDMAGDEEDSCDEDELHATTENSQAENFMDDGFEPNFIHDTEEQEVLPEDSFDTCNSASGLLPVTPEFQHTPDVQHATRCSDMIDGRDADMSMDSQE